MTETSRARLLWVCLLRDFVFVFGSFCLSWFLFVSAVIHVDLILSSHCSSLYLWCGEL